MKTSFTKTISFTLFFLLTLVSVGSYRKAQAQSITSTGDQSVKLDITPENPQPNETVAFKVTSFLSDLDAASISWYLNGSKILSDIGVREFSTKVGKPGSSTTVKLSITTHEGAFITKTITFKPSSVDLVWQASSYTPPFYKGKALVGPEQTVKIVATPDVSFGKSPKTLIYTWSKAGQVLGSLSGYGKNTVVIAGPTLSQPLRLSLKVSNADESIIAEKSITIPAIKPIVLMYKYSPLYGILYNLAIGDSLALTDTKEVTFAAVPYFFDTPSDSDPIMSYTWSINSEPIDGQGTNTMTVRNTATSTGVSSIELAAERLDSTEQKGSATFNISF